MVARRRRAARSPEAAPAARRALPRRDEAPPGEPEPAEIPPPAHDESVAVAVSRKGRANPPAGEVPAEKPARREADGEHAPHGDQERRALPHRAPCPEQRLQLGGYLLAGRSVEPDGEVVGEPPHDNRPGNLEAEQLLVTHLTVFLRGSTGLTNSHEPASRRDASGVSTSLTSPSISPRIQCTGMTHNRVIGDQRRPYPPSQLQQAGISRTQAA